MYLVYFELLKSPKLTNDRLEIQNLEKKNFNLGTRSNDARIKMINVLPH
jgi:hypothetical protein